MVAARVFEGGVGDGMSNTWTKRLAVLALLAALAAPTALASPATEGVLGWWEMAWEWVVGLWEKSGPYGDPGGSTVPPQPVPPPDHLDDGPDWDPMG